MNRLLLWLCVALWLGVAAWTGAMSYLSSLSGPEVEQMNWLEFWDKGLHFIAFSAGGFLLAGALRLSTGWGWQRIVLVSWISVSIFGAVDEWHQQHTPGRQGGDVGDWVADSLGAIAGAYGFSLLYARYFRTHQTAPART